MQFGVMLDTHIDKWDLVRYAEELGYDRAYAPDSQMIWSDPCATLALAAVNTRRIRIGIGVTSPWLRLAPVTANSIATINRLAPGRVFLGLGTGHTSMRLLGRQPASLKTLQEYLRVVRGLLSGAEVDYPDHGESRLIAFMHRDRHYINLEDPIPIYVAANGPKAVQLAGAMADGWTTSTKNPDLGRRLIAELREGARLAGRPLPEDFYSSFQTSACVLRPGEHLTDDRVINETGSYVAVALHMAYEVWLLANKSAQSVPPFFANIWEDYVKHVESFDLPRSARFRQIHDGHCTFLQPGERRFVTPEAIRATCLVGEPDEIIAQVRAMENVGFAGLNLFPPADYQRKVFRDFAELIMPAFR